MVIDTPTQMRRRMETQVLTCHRGCFGRELAPFPLGWNLGLTGPVSCGRRRRPSTSAAGSAGRHYRRTGLSSESQLYADATRASISSSTGMPFSPFVMAAMP